MESTTERSQDENKHEGFLEAQALVSKYIGETEKNPDFILAEAEEADGLSS